MIPFEKLEEMFDNIRSKTPWNIDGPMLWGYFFTDASLDLLQRASHVLTKEGYRFAGVNDEAIPYVLHVERLEIHSPTTLHQRNEYLAGFAEQMGLESYDGMDVGPVSQ